MIGARGFEDLTAMPEEMAATYLTPLAGTRDLRAVDGRLAQLQTPTAMIWSTDDPFFAVKWAYWLRDTIPGARAVTEVPGGKLFFPDERAGERAAALTKVTT